jgi:hypothetical protein
MLAQRRGVSLAKVVRQAVRRELEEPTVAGCFTAAPLG